MAILRGGKRIGGIDVRIGIPRDRSLDDVTGDPRLRQKAGGNPETTLGRFQSMVNEAEGFARKARFYVEFQLPKGLNIETAGSNDLDANLFGADENSRAFPLNYQLRAVQQQNAKRVQAFCSSIDMPDREVVMKEVKYGNSPARKIAYDFKSADVTAEFYTDKFLRERSYFELWQQSAFSTKTFNMQYYDNYVSNINIFQLGSFASRQERDDITYAVQLHDCFPKQISAVGYSHDVNNLQTFSVTFAFRYWTNYFIDQAGKIELGNPNFSDVTIKENKSLLGGLLGKLPPELRRAGRGVIEDLRRRVPIGGITGGRVFPPFKIPPLNI